MNTHPFTFYPHGLLALSNSVVVLLYCFISLYYVTNARDDPIALIPRYRISPLVPFVGLVSSPSTAYIAYLIWIQEFSDVEYQTRLRESGVQTDRVTHSSLFVRSHCARAGVRTIAILRITHDICRDSSGPSSSLG